MIRKIIYFLFFIINTYLLAQNKLEGFPAKELVLFKLTNNQMLKIATSRASVIGLLGQPNSIYDSDGGDRDVLDYKNGITFDYTKKDSTSWYAVGISTDENHLPSPYVLSQSFQLRPGFAMDQNLLTYYKYNLSQKDNQQIYTFKICNEKNECADDMLVITVKNTLIQTIYIGSSE